MIIFNLINTFIILMIVLYGGYLESSSFPHFFFYSIQWSRSNGIIARWAWTPTPEWWENPEWLKDFTAEFPWRYNQSWSNSTQQTPPVTELSLSVDLSFKSPLLLQWKKWWLCGLRNYTLRSQKIKKQLSPGKMSVKFLHYTEENRVCWCRWWKWSCLLQLISPITSY